MDPRRLCETLAIGLAFVLLAAMTASGNARPVHAQAGGDLTVVSVASDGTPANAESLQATVSADGRYVAFSSYADNLVVGDENGVRDIFVHDRQTGSTVRVSVASDGSEADSHCYSPHISAGGRYVAFTSLATTLVPSDYSNQDVFVHDRDADENGTFDEVGGIETVRVSVSDAGTGGNSHSYAPVLSADGRYVAFHSPASNLVADDNNGRTDVFVHDRDADENGDFDETGGIQTVRVSVRSDGSEATGGSSYTPAMSSDGRYIAFESAATNLADGDTNSMFDIFVHDRLMTATVRVSVGPGGAQATGDSTWAVISSDGRFVAFESEAGDLVAGDGNSRDDVFVHDRDSDEDDVFDEAGATETMLVSVPDCGGQGEEDSNGPLAISADGRHVFFRSTAQNLIGDDAGYADVFVRDLARGQTSLISAVPGTGGIGTDSCSPATSSDGRFIAFHTGDVFAGGAVYVRDRGELPAADAPTNLLHVAPVGVDQAGCGASDDVCRTPQYAVDQAVCGATVKLAAGTYDELQPRISGSATTTQVLYINKSITVAGGFAASNWITANPGLNLTTLDATSAGQVVVVRDAPTVTLSGLRLYGGRSAEDGGGVSADWHTGLLTIRGCDVVSNAVGLPGQTTASGGGVYRHGGALVLEDSRVTGNRASGNGGGIYAREAVVTMTGCTVVGNSGDDGGGAWLYEDQATVINSVFRNNEAEDGGGGLHVGWGDVLLTDNEFSQNVASHHGGGLYAHLEAGHGHTVTGNLFRGNVATSSGSGAGGGARLFGSEGAQLTFSDNRVLENVAAAGPTGANGGRGGGVFVVGPAQVIGNFVQGNWASQAAPEEGFYFGGYGGGLYLMSGDFEVAGNTILDNVAARNAGINYTSEALGGGVRVAPNTRVTMTNNIIAGNQHCADCTSLGGPYRGGGAVAIGGATTPTDTQLIMLHNTLADNQSAAIYNESAAVTVSHSVLSGHDTDLKARQDSSGIYTLEPIISADYTLWWPALTTDIVGGIFNHTSDITGAPSFVTTWLGCYRLGAGSQAIDRGPGVGLTDDIDGHPRPVGAAHDLGADEYTGVDLSPSKKRATRRAGTGEELTYTISLQNAGEEEATGTVLHDPIPEQTSYVPGSALASSGTLTDSGPIRWSGTVPAGGTVTITFRVVVSTEVLIHNSAVVSDPYGTAHTLVARANDLRSHLPLVLRSR